MHNLPLVSVLMTAYNREKYIGEAIESVLASSYQNIELIITDDCSKDQTFEIATAYANIDKRVKPFLNQKNLGDYPNRNKAASHASGKYIKYLDSDDLIYPYSLEIMVYAMEKFPEAGLGLCAMQGNKPLPILLTSREAYLEHFFGGSHFDRAPASSIICKKCFDKAGGFSGERMIGDMQLWFKLSRYNPIVKIQRDLTWNREHEGQESKSNYAKSYNELTKKVIEDALLHPDCPLTETDKINVRSHLQKQHFKKQILESKFLNYIKNKVF
ncbi:MAG TPA: glycosyltransferase family A protein [Chitinophagaceae bacterium]|jgi:Glycosyltransferases involved in cell wall biogenesis